MKHKVERSVKYVNIANFVCENTVVLLNVDIFIVWCMESFQKISDQVLKTYQTTQRLKNIIYLNPNPNHTIGIFLGGDGLIIVWCSLLWDWHPIWEVPDLIPPNPVLLTRYAVWRNRVDFCSSFCFVMIFLWYQKVFLHHTKTDVNV